MGLHLKKIINNKRFQIKCLALICTSGPGRGDLVSHIWHEVLQLGLVLNQPELAKSSVHICSFVAKQFRSTAGFTGSRSVNLS